MHRWAAVPGMPKTDDRDTSSLVWRPCMSAKVSATSKKLGRKSRSPGKLNNLIKTGSKDLDGSISYSTATSQKIAIYSDPGTLSSNSPADGDVKKVPLSPGSYPVKDPWSVENHFNSIVKTGCSVLGMPDKFLKDVLKKFGLAIKGPEVSSTIDSLRSEETRPLLIEFLRDHFTKVKASGEPISPVTILRAVHQIQKAACNKNSRDKLEIEELSNLWDTVDKNVVEATESLPGSMKKLSTENLMKLAKNISESTVPTDPISTKDEADMCASQRLFKPEEAKADFSASSSGLGIPVIPDKGKSKKMASGNEYRDTETITASKEADMCNAQRLFKPEEATSEKQSSSYGNVILPEKDKSELGKRVSKVASMLGMPTKIIEEKLTGSGVKDNEYGIKLLESSVVTIEDIVRVLSTIPGYEHDLSLRAAASILKGQDPFSKEPVNIVGPATDATVTPTATVLVNALKELRTIAQMKDRELLELYDKNREIEVEQELNRRAKNQPFVILRGERYEPGKEIISIDESMEQLKRAHKGYTVPTMVPGVDGKVVRVYRITELNPEDRIVELCPICGEILYKGYCSKCELNFAGVQDDERAYVHMIALSSNFNAKSHSDRKAIHASASKGLEDLRVTWPSIAPTFDDLKLTNNLPKLRMIKNIPAVQVADPFHVNGNRSY